MVETHSGKEVCGRTVGHEVMQKTVRIGRVEGQDHRRREGMLRMSPDERVAALIELRSKAFPDQPLKRVAHIRKLR